MRVLVVGTPGLEEPEIIKTVLTEVAPTEVIHNNSATGIDAATAQWCVENSVPEIVVPVDQTRGAEAYGVNIEEMLAQNPELILHFADDEEVPEDAAPNWQILPRDAWDRGLVMRYTNIFPVGTSVDETEYPDESLRPRTWQTVHQLRDPDLPGTTGPTT